MISFWRIQHCFMVAVIAAATLGVGSARVSAALVALWRADDTNPSLLDVAGTAQNGTLVNGASKVVPGTQVPGFGAGNKVLSLDGTNDYVSAANHADLQITSSITIAAWVYADTQPGLNRRIVMKGGFTSGYDLFFDGAIANGQLRLQHGVTGSSSNTNSITNTWHHYAATFDDATDQVKFYIDGVQNGATATFTGTFPANTSALIIGSEGGSGQFLNGEMDDIAIFNEPLSQSQIATIMTGNFSAVPNPGVISIDFNLPGPAPLANYSGSATTSGGLVPFAGQAGPWNSLLVGGTPGSVGTIGWESIGNTNTPTLTSLLDGAGAATPVDFRYNTTNVTYRAFTYSGPGGTPPTDDLGRDVIHSPGSTATWEFTDLMPGGLYDIRIFGQTDAGNARSNFATFSVNGGGPQTPDSTTNYVTFYSQVADTNGRIFGTHALNGGSASSFSGIQIQGTFAATVPEPSTYALGLIGLAGLGLVAWRRKKRISDFGLLISDLES